VYHCTVVAHDNSLLIGKLCFISDSVSHTDGHRRMTGKLFITWCMHRYFSLLHRMLYTVIEMQYRRWFLVYFVITCIMLGLHCVLCYIYTVYYAGVYTVYYATFTLCIMLGLHCVLCYIYTVYYAAFTLCIMLHLHWLWHQRYFAMYNFYRVWHGNVTMTSKSCTRPCSRCTRHSTAGKNSRHL